MDIQYTHKVYPNFGKNIFHQPLYTHSFFFYFFHKNLKNDKIYLYMIEYENKEIFFFLKKTWRRNDKLNYILQRISKD